MKIKIIRIIRLIRIIRIISKFDVTTYLDRIKKYYSHRKTNILKIKNSCI